MSFDDIFLLGGALPDYEPGDDQRWSTWAAATPTERGPRPWPAWLETSSAALDTELGVVKTGKEADVHLIERAVPGAPGCRLAAKRYRGSDHREFHRSSSYEEGRRMRSTRDARAVARGTSYGRQVAAGHWASAEFDALRRAWTAGIPVPYPVQITGTEVVMEFIGSGRTAAPRLAQTRLPCLFTIAELDPAWMHQQLLWVMEAWLVAKGTWPDFHRNRGHNHITPVLQLGSEHDTLGDELAEFVERVRRAA